ncbi:MAG: hypothetical protein ACREPY_05760 [Rhodanobacteraceae bacterium]
MSATDRHETALRDYLDALLESTPLASPAPAPAQAQTHAQSQAEPDNSNWWLCTLGRLQLLLPAAALDAAIDCADFQDAPDDWHLARLRIGAGERHVIELARIIAPGVAAPPVDSLLPIADSDWMLAVPGRPQSLTLPTEAIQWRLHRNSRKWLAGMSCDSKYMALDVHELIAAGEAGAAAEEPSA